MTQVVLITLLFKNLSNVVIHISLELFYCLFVHRLCFIKSADEHPGL